jgi:hypothetical protein
MAGEEHTYLCLPDGTVVWEPGEEDFALWRDEVRDLMDDVEWD